MQAAKTYLEKHYESFPTASLEDLVQHGLKALAATLSEGELTKQNVSVAIVGGGAPFVMLDDDDVEPYVAVSGGKQGRVLCVLGGLIMRGRSGHVLAGVMRGRRWDALCCADRFTYAACLLLQLLKAEEDAPMAGGGEEGGDAGAGGAEGAAGGGAAAGGAAEGGEGGAEPAPMET